MDIFEQEARELDALCKGATAANPGIGTEIAKSSAVVALCTRLENVLRVVDGQDIATPFNGCMNHRETSLALMKLDEVRLWVLEHLRVRKMLAEAEEYQGRVAEALQAAERKIVSEAVQAGCPDEPMKTISGWTPEEIEAAKTCIEFVDPRESGKEPPAGYRWHLRRQYNVTTDRHDVYRNLIEIA